MTLYELYNEITEASLHLPLLSSATLLFDQHTSTYQPPRYPLLLILHQNSPHLLDDHQITYNLRFILVDESLDPSHRFRIQSSLTNTLINLISSLPDSIDFTLPIPITYFDSTSLIDISFDRPIAGLSASISLQTDFLSFCSPSEVPTRLSGIQIFGAPSLTWDLRTQSRVYQLNYEIHGQDPLDIQWSIKGHTSSDTFISITGEVALGLDETSEFIEVRALSRSNPELSSIVTLHLIYPPQSHNKNGLKKVRRKSNGSNSEEAL